MSGQRQRGIKHAMSLCAIDSVLDTHVELMPSRGHEVAAGHLSSWFCYQMKANPDTASTLWFAVELNYTYRLAPTASKFKFLTVLPTTGQCEYRSTTTGDKVGKEPDGTISSEDGGLPAVVWECGVSETRAREQLLDAKLCMQMSAETLGSKVPISMEIAVHYLIEF